MYGLIQLIVEDWVINRFGLDTWAAIKNEANYADLPNGGFIRHEYYPDAVTLNLVAAAGKVAGLDVDVVLELFGEAFVRWLMGHGYASMLRSQGATLLDFLNSLDHMHRGLQEGMPRLVAPGFSCTEESGGLTLEYTSRRAMLGPMIPGMVREAGRCLFSRRYSCSVVSRDDRRADGRHRVVYSIVCEGHASQGPVTRPPPGGPTGSYAFFEQNPAMAHGWVQSLQSQVGNIRTPADAAAFAGAFDLNHLAALLVTPSREGMIALSTLFMDPLAHPLELMPVPSLGYMRGPTDAWGVETALIGSVVMCADVTCGAGALVRTAPGPGYHLAPIKVLVCVVQDPLARSILVRALAGTRSPELLSSAEAVGLLRAAWMRVRPRFLFNAATDVVTLLLLTAMVCGVHSAGMWFEALSLGVLFWKTAAEECVVLARSLRRGWHRSYVSVDSAFEWVSLLLYALFFRECWLSCEEQVRRGSEPMALFVFSRCCHLLYACRALDGLGQKILPILFTVASVGPFALVLSLVLLGFLYAYALLTGEELAAVHFSLVLGQMYGVSSMRSIDQDVPGVQVWLYAFQSIVTLLLLNLLIGIMSENYSKYQDSGGAIFNRARAQVVLRLEMLLRPCRRLSSTRYLRWFQVLVLIEDSSYEAKGGPPPAARQGPGTLAEGCPPYLWLCMHRTLETETPAPAECASEAALNFTRQLERVDQRLETLQSSLETLMAP